MNERWVLGTVQFGMRYGVANTGGAVEPGEAGRILALARASGIRMLDTAAAYGDSESVLGGAGVRGMKVITKLPACPAGEPDVASWVRRGIEQSLQRLRIDGLHGLLLHQPRQLLEPQGRALYSALLDAKARGLTRKIGISIYSPEDLDDLASAFAFDLVQAPMNVFDRRLRRSGWLARLRSAGVEIHVRSLFLQGLLLMQPQRRPAYFDAWRGLLSQWDDWVASQGASALQACVAFGQSLADVDGIVVGVDSCGHLQEILDAGAARPAEVPESLEADDPALINPSLWSIH
jgi:aryl-alcohol dehydrogenase-like predicted oxidoreductase